MKFIAIAKVDTSVREFIRLLEVYHESSPKHIRSDIRVYWDTHRMLFIEDFSSPGTRMTSKPVYNQNFISKKNALKLSFRALKNFMAINIKDNIKL